MFALLLAVGTFDLGRRLDAEMRADTWVCPYGVGAFRGGGVNVMMPGYRHPVGANQCVRPAPRRGKFALGGRPDAAMSMRNRN